MNLEPHFCRQGLYPTATTTEQTEKNKSKAAHVYRIKDENKEQAA